LITNGFGDKKVGLKLGELIILLLIVMIFFGSKRLPSLGSALGEAIKNFKKGIDGDSEKDSQTRLEEKPRDKDSGKTGQS
jgi:sec-independent protein translocase protein TatA